MCEDDGNILKWSIRIKPSDELNRIVSEIRNTVLPKNTKQNPVPKWENFQFVNFTKNELFILKKLEKRDLGIQNIVQKMGNIDSNDKCVQGNSCDQNKEMRDQLKLSTKYLQLSHIKWVYSIIGINKYDQDSKYLHDILFACAIILPKNILKRDPVLEARCQMLRAKQENQNYIKMTKNIDSTRSTLPEDTISYQVKAINKQLIAVLQFIFSVAAGFAFGFIGIELIIGNMDFGFRLLLGIICALIIALAEMYFLAKKLNEMDKIPTDQYLAKKNR